MNEPNILEDIFGKAAFRPQLPPATLTPISGTPSHMGRAIRRTAPYIRNQIRARALAKIMAETTKGGL